MFLLHQDPTKMGREAALDNDRSLSSDRRTAKLETVRRMVDHILETYRPLDGPIVLMWREVMNGFYAGPNWDELRRDCEATHRHWKRYGTIVARELTKRKLTVVKVSAKIRDAIKHGGRPDRSDSERRNDKAYREYLPSSSNPVAGIVLFPKGTQEDHPLIVSSLERRTQSATTGIKNTVIAIDTANGYEVLSDDSREKIIAPCKTTVQEVFEDKQPLFKFLTQQDTATLPDPMEPKP